MRNCLLYLSFSCFFSFSLLCQVSNKDSINSFSAFTDTAQISRLIEYAETIGKTDIDSAIKLFNLAENISKSLGSEFHMLKSANRHASFLYFKGKYPEAFIKYQQVHERALQNNNDEFLYNAKVYLGTIHMLQANYNTAMIYLTDCLNYFERKNNQTMISGLYLNMTYIQIEQKDYQEADKYARLAYEYAEAVQNEIYICKALLNIGELEFLKKDFKSALSNFKKALSMAENFTSINIKPTLWLNMAGAYTELNMPDSASFFLKKIFDEKEMNDMTPVIFPKAILLNSDIAFKRNNLPQAIIYAKNALAYSDSMNNIQTKALAAQKLSELYAHTGDYKNAWLFKNLATNLNDTIFSAEKYRFQNELEDIYETSKKQQEFDLLAKDFEISNMKNKRFVILIWMSAFIVLLTGLITILVIRQFKSKAVNEKMEIEQKLLRLQMNPHFIFNSISAIQDFIIRNNPIDASAYLSDFSSLMRNILINSSKNFISLQKEIETLESYLKLQKLRIPESLNYNMDLDEKIEAADIQVPPMLLQPFIENAIEHGILNSNKPGLVNIRFYLSDNRLIMECEDNGIGRPESVKFKTSESPSMATEITNQRIKLLSKFYKQKIEFSIIDLIDKDNQSKGTLVRFSLPEYIPE